MIPNKKSQCCNAPVKIHPQSIASELKYCTCDFCGKVCEIMENTPQEDKSIESKIREIVTRGCRFHQTGEGCCFCEDDIKDMKKLFRTALNDQKAEYEKKLKIADDRWNEVQPEELEPHKGESFRRGYEMGRREAVEEIKEKLPSSKPILHVTDDGDGYEIDEEYISDTDERFNSCLKEISDLLNTLK